MPDIDFRPRHDEEERDKEGHDDLHLFFQAVPRLGHDHPGEERPDNCGQSDEGGGDRKPQADHQRERQRRERVDRRFHKRGRLLHHARPHQHKAFTPRLIEQLRARVQTLADELLDGATPRSEMDLISGYALPLPMTIITEILGVPTEDHHKFHKWSKAVMSFNSPNATVRVIPSVWMFIRYLRRFFKVRRRDPKDDLASALIQAEEAGDKLSEDELLAMVFLLLVAGHETTVNLIGSGVLALLEHPDELEKLRRTPSLIKVAVEELLRYTSPVFMTTERYAREDVTIHGVTIPRGEMTFGVIGSANRDENVFENPDQLDLTREPNKHLSFGQGIHFCLGAPLARMEARIAINTLLRRAPDPRLRGTPESLRWRPSMFLRGLDALPVVFWG